ncbi:MAG: histidine kinase [Tepidanaerobacteraceae bacterium]|nr:histidine kinase [Tepidanaerobacteraceae bacterium]
MNYKKFIVVIIIFVIIFVIGVRTAEKGLNAVMGLNIKLKSFEFFIFDDRIYNFVILGNSFKFQRYYKIGEIYADRGFISLQINGKKFWLNSLIPTGVVLKSRPNLDKKSVNMYN